MMTNKSNLAKELQSHELRRSSQAANVPLEELDCFMCEGQEKVDGREKRVRRIRGQEAKMKPSCGVRIVQTGEKRRRRLRRKRFGVTRGDVAKVRFQATGKRLFVFQDALAPRAFTYCWVCSEMQGKAS